MRALALLFAFLQIRESLQTSRIATLKKDKLPIYLNSGPRSNEYFQIGDLVGFIDGTVSALESSIIDIVEPIKNVTSLPYEEIDPRNIPIQPPSLPWGIDRIDQYTLPLNSRYAPIGRGEKSIVYMLDTGIYAGHTEFRNRVLKGADFTTEGDTKDRSGHGTHTSSTAVGKTMGVSNLAKVVPVKVLGKNGQGTNWGVIKGIEWVVNDIKKRKACGVINMSLGGGKSQIMNAAVNAAFENGVISVVAAGNSANDACLYSPSSAASAVTVGAFTVSDQMAYFSSYGNCTKILAPGLAILGAGITSKNAVRYASGTSMSSPHVAGVIAAIMTKYGCASPNRTLQILNEWVLNGVIKEVRPKTPNKMVHIPNITDTMYPTKMPTQMPTKKPTKSG
jgi:serine protease